MKTNQREERRELAEKGFLAALNALNISPQVIREFLRNIYKERDRKKKWLESVTDCELSDFGFEYDGPNGLTTRAANRRLIETYTLTIAATIAIVERSPLEKVPVMEAADILKVSCCGIISHNDPITPDDWERYQSMVKFWRNSLEVIRMELHLSNQPSSNYKVQQAGAFLDALTIKPKAPALKKKRVKR